MREILFRGKSPINNEFVIGDLFQNGDRCFIMVLNRNIEVESKTVGQYTGLTDKNGTKIFEGDILSGHLDELFPEHESRYPVVWHDYGWHIKCDNGSFDTLEQWWVSEYLEVIGNIYDNRELLSE